MVNLSTSEEWQMQTSLLLQARPTSTRITTKYNIPNLALPKYQNLKKRKRGDVSTDQMDVDATTKVPRATLTLKTYDPESGVVLKFTTDRAAEVGRLITGLSRAGRHMAALPAKEDAPQNTADVASNARDEALETVDGKDVVTDAKPAAAGGTTSKKKKKNKK